MNAHSGDFQVVERGPDRCARTWLASCKCGEKWIGPTYEAAEDKWREHVHGVTGIAPRPMGSKTGRWVP